MRTKLLGIEEKKKKDNTGSYQIFHMMDLTTNNTNMVGNLVITEYIKEPPMGVKVGDELELEYRRNGKYFDTVLSLVSK